MKDLCGVCKTFQEIVWHEDGTGRPYCEPCLARQPLTADEWAFILLTSPWSPFGPPFKTGDVVECRNSRREYQGVGTVTEMDTDFNHGGTPVYPTWRVVMSTKASPEYPDEAWYTEDFLSRVNQDEEAR